MVGSNVGGLLSVAELGGASSVGGLATFEFEKRDGFETYFDLGSFFTVLVVLFLPVFWLE